MKSVDFYNFIHEITFIYASMWQKAVVSRSCKISRIIYVQFTAASQTILAIDTKKVQTIVWMKTCLKQVSKRSTNSTTMASL